MKKRNRRIRHRPENSAYEWNALVLKMLQHGVMRDVKSLCFRVPNSAAKGNVLVISEKILLNSRAKPGKHVCCIKSILLKVLKILRKQHSVTNIGSVTIRLRHFQCLLQEELRVHGK